MSGRTEQIRTFLFTDIQGSTHLARTLEDEYPQLLSTYMAVIRGSIHSHRGMEIDSAGDGFFIAFDQPLNAARAGIEIQKKLKATKWPMGAEVLVRMGIHLGPGVISESGYTGLVVHMTSRICDAAHGGQILLSKATHNIIVEELEPNELKYLGKFHLKGFETPEALYQLNTIGASKTFPPPRVLPALPVIAILPLNDESDYQENAYFFDGVSTDIIHALARIPGLRVVARSASSTFRGKQDDYYQIGEKLKANAILFGRMKKEDDQIGLKASFLDIDQQKEFWSISYDGHWEDVFEIQDKVIERIVQTFGITHQRLLPSKKGPQFRIQNIEAYDNYLKGRRFYYQFSQQSVLFALQMFQNAIQGDPDFALAYAGAANCYSYLYMYEEPIEFNLASAKQLSKKAIELGPMLAEAHACRGVVLSLSKNYASAEACFEKAISLDPQLFEAYYLYARVVFAEGNLQKAAGLFRDANRVRPDDYQSLLLAAQCFEKLGFLERAKEVREDGIAIVEQHLKLNPGDTRALYMGANGQAALGNHIMASRWLQRALMLEPNDPMLLYNAGCIYTIMGMYEEGLESLDRSVTAGLTQKEWFENDPDLNNLRSQPRFKEILKRLNQVVQINPPN